MKVINNKKARQRGSILIVTLVIFMGLITLGVYLWRLVGTFVYTESQAVLGEKTLAIAEAGIDKAIWELNQDSNYSGETETPFGAGEFTVSITNIDTTTKGITTTAYIPDADNPTVQTSLSIEAIQSNSVVNFPYGVQAGEGGVSVGNNTTVDGGVYSNGTVTADNNADFNGNVWVAGLANPSEQVAFENNDTEFTLGNGLDFDGSDQYAFVPDNSAYDFENGDNFSVSFWFNPRDFDNSQTLALISKKENTSDNSAGWLVYMDDDTDEIRLRVSDGDGSNLFFIRSRTDIVVPGWMHATFVYDDSAESASRLYINGVDDNPINQTSGNFNNIGDLSNDLDLVFGAESDVASSSTGHHYDGQLDEIYIYNRAITAQEAADIYNDSAPTSGQVGYWNFNDGAGQTAQDSSSEENDATLGPTTGAEDEDPQWVGGASSTGDTSYQFGHNSSYRDVAQSFIAPTDSAISQVDVRLKKIGSPSNLTLRIVEDDGGKPSGSSDEIASSTLQSSWVTSSLSWITVNLTSSSITNGATYWIVLDGGSDSSDYYHWSSDESQAYADGEAKYSKNWKSKPWYDIAADLHFRVSFGGANTSFLGNNNVEVNGDLYANHIEDVDVDGDAYYQSISNVSADNYYPGSDDPPAIDYPISDSQIDAWKSIAENGGTHSGDYNNCGSSIGPIKITGDLEMSNNCTITLTGTVWVQGDINIENNGTLKIHSSYGGNGEIIIASGQIEFENNVDIEGSGQGDSYMLVISEYVSSSDSDPAIEFGNNVVQEGIAFAPYGVINLVNNIDILEVTGYRVIMGNNIDIIHEVGLQNATFSGGSTSASWSMRDGTWQKN